MAFFYDNFTKFIINCLKRLQQRCFQVNFVKFFTFHLLLFSNKFGLFSWCKLSIRKAFFKETMENLLFCAYIWKAFPTVISHYKTVFILRLDQQSSWITRYYGWIISHPKMLEIEKNFLKDIQEIFIFQALQVLFWNKWVF